MLKNNLLLKTLLNQAEREYNKKFQYCIFPQVWPNTGLGYSLVGCDVLMAADTIVLFCNEGPALIYYESDKLSVIQYIEGEWVESDSVINGDGTITVNDVVDGPMAILVSQ